MLALGVRRIGGARDQHDVVGAVGEGAPVLVAVDHPGIAVLAGAARDVAQVRADIGFGHGGRAQELATGGTRQEHRALRVAHAAAGAEPVAAGDDRGDAHPGARQFLGDQAVFEDAETQPAILLGNDDAEITHVGQLLDQLTWDVALLRVELVGDRQHLLEGKGARRLLDHAALVGHVAHGHSLVVAAA
jgi:hypothetical protein